MQPVILFSVQCDVTSLVEVNIEIQWNLAFLFPVHSNITNAK